MRLSNAADKRPCSRKPSRSYTPLMWGLLLLVVGPVWILSRVVWAICALPEQAAFQVRAWSARFIGSALKHIREDRS